MSLCRIETEGQPAYVDPAVIAFVLPSDTGVDLCDRYAGKFVSLKTPLITTIEVVKLLEAHAAKQARSTGREAILDAGLRRLANLADNLDGRSYPGFAQSILQDAGVPEQGAGDER